jgi:hypothetical protein
MALYKFKTWFTFVDTRKTYFAGKIQMILFQYISTTKDGFVIDPGCRERSERWFHPLAYYGYLTFYQYEKDFSTMTEISGKQ